MPLIGALAAIRTFLQGVYVLKLLTIAIALLLSLPSLASGFKTEKEARSFSDSLIDSFVANKFQEGVDSAKPYWPIPPVEIDGMANQMAQQWPMIANRFGKSLEKEFIKKERIGQSFVRFYYLHKFEKHAIYWQVDFYKPQNEWKINSMRFLDSLDFLYE